MTVQHIYTSQLQTPLGLVFSAATPDGLCLLEFMDRETLPSQIRRVTRQLNGELKTGRNAHLDRLEIELNEYFSQQRKIFSLSLVHPGTPFQQAVWHALRQVPYGETRTYQQVAQLLDNPLAARAVGAANGINPIVIVIPCHRLVGANGSLTGYGGGIARKQRLLELEKGNPNWLSSGTA